MKASGTLTLRLVYVAAMFLVAMDATIVNVALLSIGSELHVPSAQTGSINIGYLTAVALSLPVAGWLGDRFGAKRVLLSAITLFTAASVCCGLAASLEQLTLFRIIQGVGGGLVAPVGMAMLFRAFPPQERAKVSRSLILPIAAAPAVGPVIGGLLVEELSWRWCFYLNLPVGMAAVLIGWLLLQAEQQPPAGRLHLPGLLLSGPGFAMVIYALTEGAFQGWTSPSIVLTGLGGLAMLAALVVTQLRASQPLLQLRLLGDRLFRTAALIGFCLSAGLLGMLYVFPLMYQDVYGASALASGLTTFPEALGLMAASQLMPRSNRRLGPRKLMVSSLLGAVILFSLMCLVRSDTSPWLIRALMFGGGFTLGHAVGAVQLLAFARMPAASMGQASTLYQVQNRLGSALGVALLGSIMTYAGAADSAAPSASTGFAYQAALLGAAGFLLLAWCLALTIRREDEEAVRPASKPANPPVQAAHAKQTIKQTI
ncbi:MULTISPECIES: DHA2 family efflux MFS transporter permease subunit [Paenibacillus]|uniref:DHA2 family efflux MFS transporter permease subunit n=1 Tax=Paenibacillus TaxID=44249 RepID=UPI0022B90A1E|nr:DHA2 family efflux MFS transporter permease subunit [Paenibacillus caseinilyticus]MCZ8519577.1 DHA2 family efflux MFS transporter permease subunit [Paenibacillus caseinilyticus]